MGGAIWINPKGQWRLPGSPTVTYMCECLCRKCTELTHTFTSPPFFFPEHKRGELNSEGAGDTKGRDNCKNKYIVKDKALCPSLRCPLILLHGPRDNLPHAEPRQQQAAEVSAGEHVRSTQPSAVSVCVNFFYSFNVFFARGKSLDLPTFWSYHLFIFLHQPQPSNHPDNSSKQRNALQLVRCLQSFCELTSWF